MDQSSFGCHVGLVVFSCWSSEERVVRGVCKGGGRSEDDSREGGMYIDAEVHTEICHVEKIGFRLHVMLPVVWLVALTWFAVLYKRAVGQGVQKWKAMVAHRRLVFMATVYQV